LKYYIIAGEASGDMQAAHLMKKIKLIDAVAQFRGWGGELMQQQGAEIVKHYKDLAFMGFTQVIANLGTILNNIKFCKTDITAYQPDAIIYVDYPGFNMRIAAWAKKSNYKNIYYICPQVWAWKAKRSLKLKRDIDLLLCILPFEKKFLNKYQFTQKQVEYIGHPLLEIIAGYKANAEIKVEVQDKLVVLLPGSRTQEIKIKLPIMLAAAMQFPDYKFIVAGAPGQDIENYKAAGLTDDVSIVFGQTYSLLSMAYAAIVTSGTATLEAGLFQVPQIVVYKGSPISYYIGKQLVKIKYISLVNLIVDCPIVKEMIQNELTLGNLVGEMKALLTDNEYRQNIANGYAELEHLLSGNGGANRAAELIIKLIKNNEIER